jgi:hypothetical protein
MDSLLAAFIGVALVLLLTQHSGLGISPDSIYYMSAADSFLAGKGFYQFDDQPFVMFPVFYPFFLSIIKLIFGNQFLSVIPYVNALLFGLLIYITGMILGKMNIPKWIKWVVLIILTTSASLLEVYTMLWSETLFIVEVLLFIWTIEKYISTYSIKHLIWMSIIAAIATDTRLAGVSIIATGGFLIVTNHNLDWIKKCKHACIFCFIASSLFAINLIRNAHLSQTLTGNRQKGVTPFIENLHYYGQVLGDWLPCSKFLNGYPVLLGFLFILWIGALYFYKWWNRLDQQNFEIVLAAYTLIYSLFMLFVATISRFETINNRLLSPFYIPFILTLVFYLRFLIPKSKPFIVKKVMTGVILITFVVGIYEQGNWFNTSYLENKQGGIGGYSDDDWLISSGLLNYLVGHPEFFKSSTPIYSNAAHAVYFRTKQHLQILPERKYAHLVNEFNKTSKQMLIWFNAEDNAEVLTLEEIGARKNLQILYKFNDGVIYSCSSK